jgi:hypothetical protein
MKINNPNKKVVCKGKVLFSGNLTQCHNYCKVVGIDVWKNNKFVIV